MSSRDTILQKLKQTNVEAKPLPEFLFEPDPALNNCECFLETLAGIGGSGKVISSWDEAAAFYNEAIARGSEVVNGLSELAEPNLHHYTTKDAAALQNVHTAFMKGELGVAENAAIWVPEKNMGSRLLPFICQQLVLVIEKKNIVANMHQAYEIIPPADGYGVFIAGPSKTADIEQSLVIGAHGPLELFVLVLDGASNLAI